MLQKRIPAWTLIAVVAAVLLLFGIGSAIHSAGWSDGFMMGMMAGGNVDGGSLAPYLALQNGRIGHSGIGGFFSGLLHFLFILFMIGLFFRFVGFLRRRKGGHGPWGHHRHGWRHDGEWDPRGGWGKHGPNRDPQTEDSVKL
jgi:hypothetical protein